MRLGGPIFAKYNTPDEWANAVIAAGYRAAGSPVGDDADDQTIEAYRLAAARHDLVIAEVGAWSNTISPDADVRKQALDFCIRRLELADKLGATVCVNIAGGRGEQWDGPHPDNFSADTFDLIVDTVRTIIDAVKPKRTFYALETMPWVYPDSPDTYLDLIRAIDREQFAVHLDPVNMISSPRRYFNNGDFIRECFAKLGPYIKTCHAKDIKLSGKLTVHLEEVMPGTGDLDYKVFLTELSKLSLDIPLIIEHLQTEEEYNTAAAYIRGVANQAGLII